MPRALIFGSGQIGQACAAALAPAGWQVETVNRNSVVDGVKFDRHDSVALAAVLGAGAGLVIDTIGYDRADADLLVPLASGIGQLITISSVSVYADAAGRSLDEARAGGFPEFDAAISETQATVPPGDDSYSTRKVAMEQRLLDGMACPVAVLRPCAIYGLNSRHPREWWFVKRILDGRSSVPLAYRGESRFHNTSATSIGALAALLAPSKRTGIFNIADPTAPSVAEIGGIVAGIMGRSPTFALWDGPPKHHVGQSPWCVPRPFVIACEAAKAAGYLPTADYAETVAPTIAWLVATAGQGDWRPRFPVMAGYDFDPFDYASEDAA